MFCFFPFFHGPGCHLEKKNPLLLSEEIRNSSKAGVENCCLVASLNRWRYGPKGENGQTTRKTRVEVFVSLIVNLALCREALYISVFFHFYMDFKKPCEEAVCHLLTVTSPLWGVLLGKSQRCG